MTHILSTKSTNKREETRPIFLSKKSTNKRKGGTQILSIKSTSKRKVVEPISSQQNQPAKEETGPRSSQQNQLARKKRWDLINLFNKINEQEKRLDPNPLKLLNGIDQKEKR
jgi:hypothetical protein